MNKLCPFCNTAIETSLVRHIKSEHGEDTLRKAVLADKRNGTPDVEIGDKYGISFSYLERVITQEYGTNISTITRRKSKITQWEPKGFQLETTTVWSFKNRGKWATHDGRYRGNWSPYIPRNLILRYSQPHEVVLDYFNPSCHLQNTGQAPEVVGKDEAPDFEHKALEGGGMNPLGE